jgi:hypothetical protein
LALAQQCCGGSLDPPFELGHEARAGPPRGDWFEKFEDNAAFAFDEAAPAPIEAGIDGGRHERERQCLIERGDAGVIRAALARSDPGSFRKDDDWRRSAPAPALRSIAMEPARAAYQPKNGTSSNSRFSTIAGSPSTTGRIKVSQAD